MQFRLRLFALNDRRAGERTCLFQPSACALISKGCRLGNSLIQYPERLQGKRRLRHCETPDESTEWGRLGHLFPGFAALETLNRGR